MDKLNYEKVFNTLVKETGDYITNNHLQCMVLGISGGIDSTVVAAICHEVSKNTGVPLIGRSLPIKNKDDEFDVSKLVGEVFCDDFKVFNLSHTYKALLFDSCARAGFITQNRTYDNYWIEELEKFPNRTPIANGNLQARSRMIHLYDEASIGKGLVMSTDNQTEYQLGFWAIHGDVGDFNPLQDLWKTEVYELARWYQQYYANKCIEETASLRKRGILVKAGLMENDPIWKALELSIALTPTDGLGISNSDLEQIGAKSYDEVDDILQTFLNIGNIRKQHDSSRYQESLNLIEMALNAEYLLYTKYSTEVVSKVWNRHIVSEFKRKKAPIYIPRSKYE